MSRWRVLLLSLAIGLVGATQAQPLPSHHAIIPEAASGFGPLQTATASRFMAVTANPHATEAARAILSRGGSAVDAAIAAQLVLGLVEPQSSGIGGGAFLLFWDQAEQRLRYYDGRETAPAAVDDRHFLDPAGKPLPFFEAVIGGAAVGVPGVVKLMALSHRRHGKLPWAELFKPAIALAEQGFAISPRLHTLLVRTPRVAVNPAIRAYFFQADGSPKPIGSRLRNRAYADTLRHLATGGEAAFYSGPIARDIVAAVRDNPSRPGKLALTDMAA
jgi:gamma-glutamyltranspeptidase/glutathione hydrolase